MTTIARVAAVLLAFTFFGCKGPVETSAAASNEGSASAGFADNASGGATKVQYISDPTLNNMNAFAITIPTKWHFQGILYQGGNCTPIPFGVFRATSPDGLSFVERLPALAWFWGKGPFLKFMPKTDCLPLSGPLSAQQFLVYLAGVMKVQYVGPEAVPEAENEMAQKALRDAEAVYAPKYAASHLTPPKTTRELARAIVTYRNGTFTMKGRLKVMIECTETFHPGQPGLTPYGGPGHPPQQTTGPPSTVDKCTAGVTYYAAPDNQYAALVRQWDTPGMGGKAQDPWQQAWIKRNQEQTQAMMNQMNRDAQARMQAQSQQFQHDQAVRQQMHEQFLATMQRGTDQSMARAQQNMNARSTATSDWVDYALDRQTVADPSTGQVSKVSSTYSYTWVDSTGKTSYQTNDPNANPNGVLQGTWTQQKVVHGDGSQ
jgi:hypothetical protein